MSLENDITIKTRVKRVTKAQKQWLQELKETMVIRAKEKIVTRSQETRVTKIQVTRVTIMVVNVEVKDVIWLFQWLVDNVEVIIYHK